MMTTYSAFFSSGLLAPHNGYQSTYNAYNSDSYGYYDAPSPALPATPLPIADDSDIEIDTDRDSTPTRDFPSSNTDSNAYTTSPSTTTKTTQPRPSLRKRRSSLTVATSPMNAIRSPARTAGAAFQLQMHLSSPSRSRSGSLSVANQADPYGGIGIGNVASESTSLVGRMRSGSVGGALRPRRGVRRLASVPAPAPPPTAPLPAIPALMLPPANKFTPHSAPLNGSFPRTPQYNAPQFAAQMTALPRAPLTDRVTPPLSQDSQGPAAIGRERSYSLGNRIDEEMKEN